MIKVTKRNVRTIDGFQSEVIFLGGFSDDLFNEIIDDYRSLQYADFGLEGWNNCRECHGQFGSWETVTLNGVSYCVKLPAELVSMCNGEVDNCVVGSIISAYTDRR